MANKTDIVTAVMDVESNTLSVIIKIDQNSRPKVRRIV